MVAKPGETTKLLFVGLAASVEERNDLCVGTHGSTQAGIHLGPKWALKTTDTVTVYLLSPDKYCPIQASPEVRRFEVRWDSGVTGLSGV